MFPTSTKYNTYDSWHTILSNLTFLININWYESWLNDNIYKHLGVAKTSDVVEIEYCTSNPDISHVTAYWRSDVVDIVISELLKRK